MDELIKPANEQTTDVITSDDPVVEFECKLRDQFEFRLKGPKSWVEEKYNELGRLIPRTEGASRLTPEAAPNAVGGHVSRVCQAYDITEEAIADLFDLSGEAPALLAAELPGSTRKEHAQAIYLLTGLGMLLHSGNSSFSDEVARKNCKEFGAYDGSNHAAYVKALRQFILGGKGEPLRLTKPGERRAVEVAKATLGLQVR